MATPNIISLTDIRGKTNVANVSITGNVLVENSIGSNSVYKISSLYVANIDGVTSADFSVRLERGGAVYPIANTIAVPADATLLVIDKNSSVYLEEGDSLFIESGTDEDLVAVVSYEELS